MTRDRNFKRLVRGRMGRTGESYAAARAQLGRGTRPSGQGAEPAGAAPETMTRQELERLPDAELVARSAAALVRRLYGRGPAAAHAEAMSRLTGGQGALLAFWILRSHMSRGLAGLCAELPHRVAAGDFWTLLEKGPRAVGDGELAFLVHRLRAEVARALAEGGLSIGAGSQRELNDQDYARQVEALELLDPETVRRLDEEHDRVAPASLSRLASHVREHPDEFVTLVA